MKQANKHRIRYAALALTLALALVMAGCGGNTADPSGGSSDGGTGADSSQPGPDADAGGQSKLVYALDTDLEHFDPFNQQMLSYAKTFGFNVFEPLLYIGEDGSYVPCLATSWEQTDPTTYVFQIRQGVSFHNGEPLTAEDVKFTIEFTQDDSVTSFYKANHAMVESVTVVDPQTVEVRLGSVTNSYLDDLCMLRIVKQGTESANVQNPVGTGPFRFVSWSPNDRVVLEKNEAYWGDGPYVDTVELRPIPDKNIAVTNLESGDIQLMENLPFDLMASVESNPGLSLVTPTASNTVVHFEVGLHNVPEFANPNVMRALTLALDRDTIAGSVYSGMAKPLTSIYPSAAKYKVELPCEYNLELARQILEEEGVSGLTFSVDVLNGTPEFEQIAVYFQASLAQIGVTVNINKLEMAQWIDSYLGRTYDMTINQYSMGGLDPGVYNGIIMKDLVSYVLPGDAVLPGLMAQGDAETDDAARAAIYREIQEYVDTNKCVIPIAEIIPLYGATANVSGVRINMVGHTFLGEARVD